MGSPINFSGFNQIDFNMILNAVMQQERAPLAALETRKKALETQNTTFGTFATKLGALESAVKDLAETTSLAKVSATSSDAGVGVTTTTGTVEGTHDVVVSQLARAQVTTSSSTYASVDTAVATAGAISLLTANQPPVDIVVTGSMTLKQLADAINASTSAPVNASVVQASPGTYQLVLTGRTTGADNAFTIASTLTGGAGVTFTDTNANNVFGEAADGNTQTARNASLTVNSLPITSAGNDVTDAVPGVTLNLKTADATRTATVTVKRDSAEVAKTLDAFVKAYNDVVGFLTEQNTAAATGKTSVARDPILRSLRDSLRTTLLAEYAEGGTYSRLATIGLGFEAGGKLTLDHDRLTDALADSPASVQKLFAGATGTGGVFGAVEALVEEYTETGGFVATARQRLGDQVTSINRRLDTLESQLAIRRAALQQQYIAADMAMTQLKAQSSSLSAIGAQYRLF